MDFLEFTDSADVLKPEFTRDEIPLLKQYLEQYDKAMADGNTETAKFIKTMIDGLKSNDALDGAEQLEAGVFRDKFTLNDQLREIDEQDDGMLGNPETDSECWHPQAEDYSCSIACQTFITEQLTGELVNENEYIDAAKQLGWYFPEEGGTYNGDIGKLCELSGLNVERTFDNSFETLAEVVESDSKAIVNVNNMVLQNPAYADMPGIVSNHSVEVIGIDYSNPDHVEVILNDPGVENGQGIRHSLETFMKAWNTGGNFICEVSK